MAEPRITPLDFGIAAARRQDTCAAAHCASRPILAHDAQINAISKCRVEDLTYTLHITLIGIRATFDFFDAASARFNFTFTG